MRHADWGTVCPRWAGIRSAEIDVLGTTVHHLVADGGPGPVQLLVNPMAGSATMWLDVIPRLTALGPVVAPDLPGTLFGHTVSPHPRAAKAEPNARFLRAFTRRLGIEGAVVHGWSMGGLVALLFGALDPVRAGRLVLVTPALPWPQPPDEARWWRVYGRPLLSAATPVARAAVRVAGRPLVAAKLRMLSGGGGESPDGTDRPRRGRTAALPGGDLARLSPEIRDLLVAEVRAARSARLADAVTAFASVVEALFADPSRALAAVGAVRAPTLVLTGGRDQVITGDVADALAVRRPDWRQRVFPEAGHLLPLEDPAGYAGAVTDWLHNEQ